MNEFFVNRRECPCCGAESCSELYRCAYSADPIREYLISFYSSQGGVEFEYLQEQDYILVECANCGLTYQSEIPNDFLMKKLYEEWIDPQKSFDLNERSRGIEYFDRLSSEIVQIVRYLGRPPMELKMLDYSMGWGHWCRIARSFGCAVHGTEFSRPRIDYAAGMGVTVIDYTEIATHQYDFINTEQVFEHLPDVRTTLMHLKESLSPGGLLKISVPNGWDIMKRLDANDWRAPKSSPNSLNPVAPLEHINCFNHSALLTLATDVGLEPAAMPALRRTQRGVQAVKEALRPVWHRIQGIRQPPRGMETRLFFRNRLHSKPIGDKG